MKKRMIIAAVVLTGLSAGQAAQASDVPSPQVGRAHELETAFHNPPDAARPGVYWYFMDGNLNGKEMTADLESMKAVGLGNLVFLEVNVGVPRGPVKFMSEPWQELFAKTVHDAERLGIDISLGTGPGWCGSGGPWVKPEQSMQHLVFSTVEVKGPAAYNAVLPLPGPRPTRWHKATNTFYQDVAVYAFPSRKPIIAAIDEKALYGRDPFTSKWGVKPYLPTAANYVEPGASEVIQPKDMVDISSHLKPDGTLTWDVPAGDWTILRMGCRVTGACSRPAPAPGVGLECDKFNARALEDHLENFVGTLLKKIGPRAKEHGLTTLHIDSWEMGAQNWTAAFLDEFKKRRGYDARPLLPIYSGRAIQSLEQSERFLWDVRMTSQELILENHAKAVKRWGQKNGMQLSIEPYDMTPLADLDLGSVADVPMGEFWSDGYDSSFSCIEASSIGHVMGRPIVSAEAFTGQWDGWQRNPTSLKNQGDWAFCIGINRFVYHTFAHQTLGEAYKPGMTMAWFGVHWDRGQTWWPMAGDYHRYITRCSHLLRQGVSVSDVLYLTPEGAPQVFKAPARALKQDKGVRFADKKGYGFDGCSPNMLMDRAEVKEGRVTFPGGSAYRLVVLPRIQTMTPRFLRKISSLVRDGATLVGAPPLKSPSLSDYPACDEELKTLAQDLWGTLETPATPTRRAYGKGGIHWGGELTKASSDLYPAYELTADLLKLMGLAEDFSSDGSVRYGHRQTADKEIYFVANITTNPIKATCQFRVAHAQPELWDPVTGEQRRLPQFEYTNSRVSVPLEFDAFQSFFVLFDRNGQNPTHDPARQGGQNFPELKPTQELSGSWDLAFDPKWGGPEKISFDALQDWTNRPEPGIKYYSGIATYRKAFECATLPGKRVFLDLGTVHDMARVRLNGKDLGVVWCAPWRVEVSGSLRAGTNQLEIEVANCWANRLIGDRQKENANVREVQWPEGYLGGKPIKTGRYTFTTGGGHKENSPLLPSGLLGPVRVMAEQ